jgi:hypothetical protein
MDLTSKISKYLTLGEAVRSDTAKKLGLSNLPNEKELEAIKNTAVKIFDPAREFVGGPLLASSFFRSPSLNKGVPGASTTSQHIKGEAIDIDCKRYGNGTNMDVFRFIRDNLDFDQLIYEKGTDTEPAWVHASTKLVGKNRKQVLRTIDGKSYFPFKGD